jgi:hypothetical protein
VPEVECTEYGTPLISDVFAQAQQLASYPFLCYANADMILMSDLARAVQRVADLKKPFLMIGRRWNLDITSPLTFDQDWEQRLRTLVERHGDKGYPVQIDYFVFRRGMYQDLPPFAVGRPGWDGWLLGHTRRQGYRLIEVTSVKAVHQNHDYTHVPMRRGKMWMGPEADRNYALTGGQYNKLSIDDVTWVLNEHLLIPAVTHYYLRYRWRKWVRASLYRHLWVWRIVHLPRQKLGDWLVAHPYVRLPLRRLRRRSLRIPDGSYD